MPQLTLIPSGLRIRVKTGDPLHDSLLQAGSLIEAPCGGDGRCGKCRVRVQPPNATPPTPHDTITPEQAASGIRLACRLRAPNRNLQVELLSQVAAIPVHHPGSALVDTHTALAVAIDIGTTTLAASLLDLASGARVAQVAALNPQRIFGHDVISRIHRGSTPEGLAQLGGVIRSALRQLVARLCAEVGAETEQVTHVAIGGNPAMLQLAAGIDPQPLGVAPYRATLNGGATTAHAFGLDACPDARVFVPPVVDAFIGADVLAGLLVAAPWMDGRETVLLADLGTNGELVLRSPRGWLATSAAAGPAFEGMGLSSGMSAVEGAIAGIELGTDDIRCEVLGDGEPRGICGSGAVDLVATLRSTGIIEPTGRFAPLAAREHLPESLGSRLVADGEQRAFAVTPEIRFTQHDVRQFQLAKGAIRAAIDVLLDRAGVSTIDRIVLAGSFGARLNHASAEAVGLLPTGVRHYELVGNASLLGCEQLLTEPTAANWLHARAGELQTVNLAEVADYMDRFASQLEFS